MIIYRELHAKAAFMLNTNTRNLTISLILIGSITFLIYLPALNNGFVEWDDPVYVIENIHIRLINLQSLNWMLFSLDYYNWHPLTWFSLAVDYALWGLNPVGYHLTNIVLHTINTLLVVILARMLFVLAKRSSAQALQFPDGRIGVEGVGKPGIG